MTTNRRNEIFSEEQETQQAHTHAKQQGMAHDIMRDEFGFEIPVELVPLPSNGKVFPEDHPLHGKRSLEITAMTAREEDILTSRALIKKGTVITELLRSCLVDKRIQPEHMLSGDRNALMVAIRITGYGQEYSADIVCEGCNETSPATFDLAQLPIKALEIDPIDLGSNLFEFQLPRTKVPVQFAFLTGNDEETLLAESERRKKKLRLSTDNFVTSRLEKCLVSVNGITDRNKIGHFIRKMPAMDSRALRKYIDEHEPGVEMKQWIKCEHCGEDQLVSMPIGASFFWPDA